MQPRLLRFHGKTASRRQDKNTVFSHPQDILPIFQQHGVLLHEADLQHAAHFRGLPIDAVAHGLQGISVVFRCQAVGKSHPIKPKQLDIRKPLHHTPPFFFYYTTAFRNAK